MTMVRSEFVKEDMMLKVVYIKILSKNIPGVSRKQDKSVLYVYTYTIYV